MNTAVIMAITRVLYKHECAVIPGFGAFILRKNYGVANPFSGQLKPSVHSVFFNANIQEDDGFVSNELKEISGLQFRQASSLLTSEFQALTTNCTSSHAISIGDLGKFHRNAMGDLFFLASPTLNLSKETYGLPIIDWQWKDVPSHRSETNPAPLHDSKTDSHLISNSGESLNPLKEDNKLESVAEHHKFTNEKLESPSMDSQVSSDHHHSEFTESKRQTPLLWRMAASFAIISIGAGVLLTIAQIWSVSTGNDMASLLPQDSQKIISNPPIESQIDKFIIVDENSGDAKSPKTRVISHKLKYAQGVDGIAEFKKATVNAKGKFVILGGAYLTASLGERECLLWQRLGIDACLIKGKKSSLLKVVLGRFESDSLASDYAETIKILPTGTLSVSDIALDWNN
jgi:nucleoid DNA-binding protein